MVLEPVLCPSCGSNDVVKHGQSAEGKQRYGDGLDLWIGFKHASQTRSD